MSEQRVVDGNRVGAPPWSEIARLQVQRPWPPPPRPWLISQTWEHALFAHWPVSPALLRPLLPAPLALDTFAGDAWVGIVPFQMGHLAPRGAPAPLGLAFPEINVRTYVTLKGKPGVWFFSLDAANLLAVVAARATFHLPYVWAAMQMHEAAGEITFHSLRRRRGAAAAQFSGRYEAAGPVFPYAPASLEQWLTARYCFYAANHAGDLFRAEINHDPWPLQPANAEIAVNTMVTSLGIDLAEPPLLHLARRLDIVAWWPERLF